MFFSVVVFVFVFLWLLGLGSGPELQDLVALALVVNLSGCLSVLPCGLPKCTLPWRDVVLEMVVGFRRGDPLWCAVLHLTLHHLTLPYLTLPCITWQIAWAGRSANINNASGHMQFPRRLATRIATHRAVHLDGNGLLMSKRWYPKLAVSLTTCKQCCTIPCNA